MGGVRRSLLVLTVLLLLSACSGPSATLTHAGGPVPTATAVPVGINAPASPTPPPVPLVAAKKGTLEWYIQQLPQFDPPPAPQHVTRLPTSGAALQVNQVAVGDQRVGFITIDDGWTKDPDVVTLLRAAHVPFTMFLTTNAIKDDPRFFLALGAAGGQIEDHTVSHPQLSHESYDQQRQEICNNRTTLTNLTWRAPTIMRAPYGLYNADTLRAAASCGIRANVYWDEYAITGSVTYQRPGGIHPGDMVLMHFDQYLKANLLATLQAFHRDRITPALLEDYLV
jgi:peptidoglycan/xylan/chitin deacetylase (PgdA/CDA1 family)